MTGNSKGIVLKNEPVRNILQIAITRKLLQVSSPGLRCWKEESFSLQNMPHSTYLLFLCSLQNYRGKWATAQNLTGNLKVYSLKSEQKSARL